VSLETELPVKKERNWDAFAAVIASLIGLLALLVSGYTAYLQRQQVRAQVWPRIEAGISNLNLTLIASNNGMGPARVTGVKVTVDDKPIQTWADVIKAFGYTGDEDFVFSTISERVFPPGATVEIFKAAPSESSQKMFADFLEQKQHNFKMQICYCSVLDECWLFDDSATRVNRITPIKNCPFTEAEQFQN
jgi:hypothetical protein